MTNYSRLEYNKTILLLEQQLKCLEMQLNTNDEVTLKKGVQAFCKKIFALWHKQQPASVPEDNEADAKISSPLTL